MASLLQRLRSTEINQTLHDVSPSPELVHFRKLLPINGILPGPKFTLRPSLAFSYISALGYCAALEQWVSAKLRRSAEGATYIRQGGHHVGH